MKRRYWLISCLVMTLAEISKPGQLTYGFPFFHGVSRVYQEELPLASSAMEDEVNAYLERSLPQQPEIAIAQDDLSQCLPSIATEDQLAHAQQSTTRANVEALLGVSGCAIQGHAAYLVGGEILLVQYEGDRVASMQIQEVESSVNTI